MLFFIIIVYLSYAFILYASFIVCKSMMMPGEEREGGEGRVSLVFRRTNGKGSGCTKGMHKGLISNTVDSTRGII